MSTTLRRRETPALRWFDKYPPCGNCGKTAHGILRGLGNESYGAHCQKCADKRLVAAKRIRDTEGS